MRRLEVGVLTALMTIAMSSATAQSRLDQQVSEITDDIDGARQCISRLDSALLGMMDASPNKELPEPYRSVEHGSRQLAKAGDEAASFSLGLRVYAFMTYAPDKRRAAPFIARIKETKLQAIDIFLHFPEKIVPRFQGIEATTVALTTLECVGRLRKVQQLIRDVTFRSVRSRDARNARPDTVKR